MMLSPIDSVQNFEILGAAGKVNLLVAMYAWQNESVL